ncbi:MAG TPA: DUF4013 domain-containing protein [Vicinamibacteria bacterium]|jgi:hypothetical protein
MATATPAGGSFDFARGFSFVFDDPEWVKKMLIGGAYTLAAMLLVGMPFVAGYAMRLTRNAARGMPRPLPAWDDMGGLFGEGMQLVAVSLAYMAAFLLIPGAAVLTIVVFTGGFAAMGGDSTAAKAAGPFVALAVVGLYAAVFLGGLALFVYFPAALARVALTGRVGAGFAVRDNVAFITRNPGNYALALVLYLLANLASQFGVVLCCVGILPATFWSYCVLAWSMGEVARLDPFAERA